MAYFKLTLLTPYSSVKKSSSKDTYNSIYFEDLITEFTPQLEQYKSKQNHASPGEVSLLEGDEKQPQDNIDNDLIALSKINHPIDGYDFDNPDYNFANRKFSTSFSYSEKITLSQNAQKTLSFSMNRYIIRENERLENPFVNLIQTGSQLLLTDQYNNEMFFTVTNIKYTIKETNIVYDYSCQDSFSYQLSKQNQGYTIDNDPTSADFIGPKTADWWIVHKVVPECYITNYSYIPCSRAIYESTDGSYILCDTLKDKTDVKRIIKEPHVLGEDNYYTTFAYSCSGQNAASTLIDIASKINMQLKTFEHAKIINGQRTKYFDRYFWFEPLKNEQRVGLVYSPRRDIQTFDLTHNGQSLTTVMTVQGPTYNDEIITLIPDIPLFFHNYFLRPDWDIVDYSSGMFIEACSGQSFVGDNDFSSVDIGTHSNRFIINIENFRQISNVLLLKISNNEDYFKYNADLYQHFTFISKEQVENQQSQIQFIQNNKSYTTKPQSEVWFLTQAKDPREQAEGETNQHYEEYLTEFYNNINNYNIFYPGQNFISNIDKNKVLYLGIFLDTGDIISSINYAQCYLKFFRDTSQEELEFAQIADQCPWLENKLIDFNYFYKQNIISKKEYNELINILYNDLRKVNGRLIYYTQAYYKAIHDKTEMLANLTNQLDSLGAAAQAAIVDPLATTGKVKDLSYFANAYNTVFETGEQEIMGLLNYNEIVSDYFTKYFNSQQRFLKNIYNFRQYFNAENPLHNKALYHYTLSIAQPNWEDSSINWNDVDTLPRVFYGFSDNKFISLTNTRYPYNYYSGYNPDGDDTSLFDYGKAMLEIFLNENGRLTPTVVASRDKWINQKLYRYPNFNGDERFCNNTARYNEEQQYLKVSLKLPISKETEGTNKDKYYWIRDTEQNHRWISTSTQNYRLNNIQNDLKEESSMLYGLYRIILTKNDISYSAICKAEKISKDNNIYYIYFTPIHQGEWTNSSTGDIISDLFDVVSFENGYVSLNNISVQVEGVFLDPSNIYQQIYFDNDTDKKESYTPKMVIDSEDPSSDITECFIGLVKASQQDIKDNWIFKHFNNKDIFVKTKPFYAKMDSIVLDDSFKEMNKWCSVQMYAYVKDKITLEDLEQKEDDKNPFDETAWNPNTLFTSWCTTIYKENFPVTDFYAYTPRYRVTKKDDKYIFERLNEKNQSFNKYLEYVFNTSNFILPEVQNPYGFEEYQKINFVNKQNEGNYYRRVIDHPNAGLATGLSIGGAGLFIFGPAAPWTLPLWAITASVAADAADSLAETHQHWDVSGLTSRNFYGDRFNRSGKERFSGYISTGQRDELVYAVTENSFATWKEYLDAFKKSLYYNADSLEPTTATIYDINNWESLRYYAWGNATLKTDSSNRKYLKLTTPVDTQSFYYTLFDQHIGYHIYNFADQRVQQDTKIISANNSLCTVKIIPSSLNFVDTLVEPLLPGDIVSKQDNLFMLWLGEKTTNVIIRDSEKFNTFLMSHQTFSSTYYYPLVNNLQKINISSHDWGDQSSMTVAEIITNGSRWNLLSSAHTTDNYFIHIQNAKTTDAKAYIVLFRIKDYKETYISDYYEYQDNIAKKLPRFFDNDTKTDFNYFGQEDIIQGFYRAVDITKDRVLAPTVESDFNMDSVYYSAEGTRIYTIDQLKNLGNYVYLRNFVYEKDDIGNSVDTFHVSLSEYTINYKQKNKTSPYYISSIEEKVLNDIYEIQFDLSAEGDVHPIVTSTKIIDINESTSLQVNLLGNWVNDISGISNGTFWYLYHTSLDLPILFSTAAAIEAELTGYWNEAYNASKFCEYFLPESWTPTSNQHDNMFSPAIFAIKEEEDNDITTYTAELLNSFLPEVNLVRGDSGSTILKRYKYEFSTDPIRDVQHFSNSRYVLEDNDLNNVSSTSVIQNNYAIRNAMKTVYRYDDQETINAARKWRLVEIGNTSYYYSETGGTTWAQLVQRHVSNHAFNEFDGWYVMALRWLKRHYQNWILTEYEDAKKEHDDIWNKIYQDFGHILLENTYKSETATSSTELLNEAILNFKDRVQPERQYNITVIDTASLENYSGAEIRIGDGIRVKATDYYDQQDLIYESLTKYLFITDINYTLRDATNFALTVNDIKYADTIIKRLAKLIK